MEGVTLSLSTPPPSLQVDMATKCASGPIWMGTGWGMGLISAFFSSMHCYPGLFGRRSRWCSSINQTGKKHQSGSFCPDLHSSSFQRPGRKEMNIASGCPMFIRIEHLTEWRLCERWLNIPSSGDWYFRPPKDHPMKTLMNSNLKMNNSVDWNKFWCWHNDNVPQCYVCIETPAMLITSKWIYIYTQVVKI